MSPSLQLSDGRNLGYELLGDPDGTPLFFFHGTPGARFVLTSEDRMAQIPGVRVQDFVRRIERIGGDS